MKYPNFIVVGAHKAGTTSLHYYLKQHPEVYLIPNKGEDLLARRKFNSIEESGEYLAQYEGATNQIALGEVSSVYLHREGVPQRIKTLFPDMKIIAILRNPAERAYSHACFDKPLTKKEIENFDVTILDSPKFLKA